MSALAGVRVLELGGFISGPYAGQLLAELGADVVKIEPPKGGDPFRDFGGGGYSPQFCAYNQHKRSVALDLSQTAAVDALRCLTASADVMLDNMRPAVLDRLGLSDASLIAANPRLIRASLTGFGASGPLSGQPAYDTVAMARGGLLSQLLDPEHPAIAGPAMADAISGLYTALGIMGALVERERTGRGRRVEVAMTEAVSAFATEPFSTFLQTGRIPGPYDRAAVSQSYALRCADGLLISLHLSSPEKFWTGLLAATGLTALAADERFATRTARIRNYGQLSGLLAQAFRLAPREVWLQRLVACDVPHAPVNDLAEAVADEQARHLGTFITHRHPVHGDVGGVAGPVRYDGVRSRAVGSAPPALGEHTREVLAEAGLAGDALDALFASGAAG